MKKMTALMITLILALSLLAACGGGNGANNSSINSSANNSSANNSTSSSNSSGNPSSQASGNNDNSGGGDIDLEKAAENILEEAVATKSFSVAAADASLKARGVSKSAVEPDWPYTIDEDKMQAYGDNSHGVIRFTKNDGYLEDGEYDAWKKKAFEATAAASDDGYNIQGFSWGDGDIEITWDEFINSESWMETWSYRYKGTIMDVYVEVAKEKDSELLGDPYWDEDEGMTIWPEWTHYYNGVQIDIADGLQKSWDDTWQDLDDVFDQYGDEIEDALKDFAG